MGLKFSEGLTFFSPLVEVGKVRKESRFRDFSNLNRGNVIYSVKLKVPPPPKKSYFGFWVAGELTKQSKTPFLDEKW